MVHCNRLRGDLLGLDPTGTGRKRWMTRWKAALNAFEITMGVRTVR